MDVLERKDFISTVIASLLSASSQSANARVDVDEANQIIKSSRGLLFKLMLPYIEVKEDSLSQNTSVDYDKYFDLLDEINAKNRNKDEAKNEDMNKGQHSQ